MSLPVVAEYVGFGLRFVALGLAIWWIVKTRDVLMATFAGLLALLAPIPPLLAYFAGSSLALEVLTPISLVGTWVTGTVLIASVPFVGRTLQDRRDAGDELERNEAFTRLTLDSIRDAVFLTDDHGRFTHVWQNIAALGVSPEEALEVQRAADIMGGDFELPGDGELKDRVWNVECPDGESRVFLVNARRTTIGPGRVLFTCRDITERERHRRALEKALAETSELQERLAAENFYLREEVGRQQRSEEMVGSSAATLQMLEQVSRVANTDTTVLIRGETGVGKELVARAIHNMSARRNRSLVRVNAAALPPSLMESELFGHERGAFTGATRRKAGRFELADGGTLFLDEIGELPLELQPKILRALQDGTFERVGGTETLEVDVRVLAATNRTLETRVAEGAFRADLLYRLNVYPIDVPPLRDRKEDVPLLVSFFLESAARRLGKAIEGVSAESMRRMMEYDWPGNIRQLEHVLERAAIRSETPMLRIADEDLGSAEEGAARTAAPASDRLEDVERAHFTTILEQTDWTVEGPGGAATVLGLNPSTLRSRLKKLGIRRPS